MAEDKANTQEQFSQQRSNSSSKGEGVESKIENSCSPTRVGTLKKGTDSGFNDAQICNCLNKTAAAMSSMLMAANTVRAAACEGECGYVSSEKEKKMAVDSQILEADAACKEKLGQICKRWQDLLLCKAPQELARHISEQCKACDALIDSKKSFAELIRAELKAVDEDYHRMFRQQAKDVDVLVMSMGTQVIDLHNTHIEELCTIENDFQAQRKDLLLRLIKRYTRSSLAGSGVLRLENYFCPWDPLPLPRRKGTLKLNQSPVKSLVEQRAMS